MAFKSQSMENVTLNGSYVKFSYFMTIQQNTKIQYTNFKVKNGQKSSEKWMKGWLNAMLSRNVDR